MSISPSKNPVVVPEPKDEVAHLKPGEYMVHVYIEETRGLRNPKAADSTVDPIIEVKTFRNSRFSKVQKGVGSGATFWGEHFFFEKNFDTTFELETERVVISISDHSSFGLDSLIGNIELNIPAIYQKNKHCLQHQWAALSGLTKDFYDVLGFLKFSVGVFGPDDEQVPLNEERTMQAPNEPIKTHVLYPPQIVTTAYQIHLRVFRAEKLKKMDSLLGKTDPYVHVIYGGKEIKTTILKVTLDPVWNEELLIPTSLPTINDRLTFKLLDWESAGADELMGTVYFMIPDVLADKYKKPFWVNIYGSHSDVDAYNEKMQNEIPELGTEWKGRVQIALHMEQLDRPVLQLRQLKDASALKSADSMRKETYELRVEVHYAMNLPTENEDYTIRIRWGPIEASTKKKTSKHRLIEFYESIMLTAEFPVGNSAEFEIPDVFIYLNNGKKDISYHRKAWTYYKTPGAKPKLHHFKVDKGLSKTRSDLAGLIKMRALVSKPNEKASIGIYGWDKPVQKRQTQIPWKIHFNVFQARDLIAGDASGLSDAFLSAYFYGTELETSTIDDSINPIWNERLEFGGTFEDANDAPPLVVTVWDRDEFSHDFIGNTIIKIKPSDLNPETLPQPTWFQIKYGKKGGHAGHILASVCCYNRNNLIPRSPYIAPEAYKYYINMKILGLRQLESTGLIPVKRAFVKFDVDSLRTKADKAYLPEKKYLKTEPLEPGPNPNILTVINLELELPANPDYCPSMSGAVFDYILKGLSQPLLGNFSIPLGDHIKKTSAELDKRIEMLSKLFYATEEQIEHKKSHSPSKHNKAIEPFNIEMPASTQRKSESKKNEEDLEIQLTKQDPNKLDESDLQLDTEGDQQPLIEKKKTSFIQNLIKKRSIFSGEKDVKIDISRKNSSQKSSLCDHDPTEDVTEQAKLSKKFVVYSRFGKEGEELDKPDLSKYIELGHNNKERTSRKHYRYFMNGELENTEFIDASPFAEIPIFRGRQVTAESFLGNIFEASEHYRCVGYLKAMINIMNEFDKVKYDAKIKHVGQIAQTRGLEFSDDEFLRKRDVTVRLYIIGAEGLPDKDDDSNSDPYLVVKLGKAVYNEKKEYQENNPNPKFYKCFEFPATLPGASKLTIQLWDYDTLDADDLIGSTTIDIEDRWYSTRWRSLKHIPIETRKLHHPSSKLPQGTVKLWLDILPKDVPEPPVWNIAPKPEAEFELRVVVWECKDVPNVDIEDAVDIYITGKMPDGQQERTDTHFRSQNGKGSFNWRMVFPVKLPMKKHRINFQIWDKDILSANDYISEASLDFDAEALRAFEKEELVNITGPNGKDQKFWVPCTNSKVVDGRTQQENLGSILISMALVPKTQAVLTPVGKGRENPNQNPYLPPPDGRFEWTWSISKLYQQLIGPLARRKIIMWISIGLCIFILIMTIPVLVAESISRIFTPGKSSPV